MVLGGAALASDHAVWGAWSRVGKPKVASRSGRRLQLPRDLGEKRPRETVSHFVSSVSQSCQADRLVRFGA